MSAVSTQSISTKSILKPKRQRRCKVCRNWFRPFLTTQPVCATAECALEWARRTRAKQIRREKREGRERIKTLSQLCVDAQKHVNRYVRMRDAVYGRCICGCGRGIDDAGHFFPIGSKYRVSRLRFAVKAIHGCCAKCNRFVGGGNVIAYEQGLRDRYGDAYVDEIKELKRQADCGELPPLTKDEVRQIGAEHRRLIRELSNAMSR